MKQRVTWLVLLLLLLTGCSQAFASNLRTVRLQLKWKHQYQFAGYYAAIEKGYYRDAGLDVQLLEAQPHETPFDAVAAGRAEFGTSTTDILIARSKGFKPVVLANIFQHSPHIIITKEDSGIRYVHDLIDKRIATEPFAADLYAFLLAEGMKPDRIKVEELDFSMDKFINGEVDAITAYSTDQLFPLQQAGYKLNILWPSSSGIDFYGDLLFTREELINKEPKLVERFRSASLKGWAYALNNQEELITLIYNKYSKRHSPEHLRFEANATGKLIQPDVVEIGYTNPGRWEHIIEAYKSMGYVDKDFSINGLLYRNYQKQPLVIPWRFIILLVMALAIAIVLVAFFYRLSKNLRKEIAQRALIQEQLTLSNQDLMEVRSELQTKNATLTGVLESMQEVIFSVDANMCYTSFNNRFAQIAKLAYGVNIKLGDNALNYVTPTKEHQFLQANIRSALAGNFTIQEFFSGQERESRFYEAYFSPIIGTDASVIGATVFAKDISDRKRHEAELKSMNEDLEQHVTERTQQLMVAMEEIDDLAYSLSHDLRTPLRGINGFSSMLAEDYADVLDDDAKRHLDSIKNDALHLGEVLDSLHSLSKVSRQELELSNANLSDIAQRVILSLLPAYADREVDVSIQEGLIEYCDRKLMITALENLLNNALKFTCRADAPKIEFGAISTGATRAYYIKDNGIGFNMEYVNKLFRNFQRLHRSNDFEGIGIGLATVRRIVLKHGGKIWAESAPGKGATFYFTLSKYN